MPKRFTQNWYRFHSLLLAAFAAVACPAAQAQIPTALSVTSSSNVVTYNSNPSNVPASLGYTGIPGPAKVVGTPNGGIYYADETNDYGGAYYIPPGSVIPQPIVSDVPGTTDVLSGERALTFDAAGDLYVAAPYGNPPAMLRIPNENGTLNPADAVDLLTPLNQTPCNGNSLCAPTGSYYLTGDYLQPEDVAIDPVTGVLYVSEVTCTTCNGNGVIFSLNPDGTNGNTLVNPLPGAGGTFAISMAIDANENLYYTDGTYIWEVNIPAAQKNGAVPVKIGAGFPTVYAQRYLKNQGLSLDANGNLWVNIGQSPCDCFVVFPYDPALGGANPANQYVSASSTYGQFAVGFGPFNTVYNGEGYEPSGHIRVNTLSAIPFGTTQLGVGVFGDAAYFNFNAAETVNSIATPSGGNNSSTEFAIGSDPGTCAAGTTYTPTKSAIVDCSVFVGFVPQYPGVRAGAVTLNDANGNAVGTAFLSGFGQGPQAALLPGTASSPIAAGTVVAGVALNNPVSPAIDGSGNIFVADTGNDRIIEIPAGGSAKVLSTAGTGMVKPVSLALDGAGNLYIADQGGSQILEVTPQGVASVLVPASTAFLGETLDAPTAVATDNLGDVFILNADGAILQRSPQLMLTVPLPAKTQFSGNALKGATAFITDSMLDFYIADTGNNRIVEYNALAASATVINTGSFTFQAPAGIALDAASQLYVADASGVSIVNTATGDVSEANFGAISAAGADGVAIDASGDLVITSDSQNAVAELAVGNVTLTFPDQAVGSTSVPQSVTITNIGNSPLVIGPAPNPTVDSGDVNFQPAAGTCKPGASIAPTDSCTIAAVFSPQSGGTLTGTLTLAANTASGSVVVNLVGTGATLSSFKITGLPAQAPAGGTVNFTVTAYDAAGNPLPGYTGTVHFSSTDPAATLPADYTFTAADQSSHTFQAIFNTPGAQTITVTDTKSGISATSAPVQVAAAAAAIAVSAGDNQSAPLGQPFATNLAAIVTDAGGAPVQGALVTFTAPTSGATGTFATGGTTAQAYTNASGIATAPAFSAGGVLGSYVVAASVRGVSGTANFHLTNAAGLTSTTLRVSPASPSTYGQPVTLAATVGLPGSANNGISGPTGSVTFNDGTTALGTAILTPVSPANGTSTATLVVPSAHAAALTGGSHSLTATYSGDANYGTSTSSPGVPYTVSLATVTISGPTTAVVGVQGSPTTLAVTIVGEFSGPGISAPTGNVTFTYTTGTTQQTGSAQVVNGVANVVLPAATPAGTFGISIAYSGDVNYQPATTPSMAPISISIPGFAFQVDPAYAGSTSTLTVSSAETATLPLDINGFASYGSASAPQTVTLACFGLPANTSCTFLPSSVTFVGANQQQSVEMDISTTSPSYVGSAGLLWLPGLALACYIGFRRRRIPVWGRGMLAMLLLLTGVLGISACGGGVHQAAAAGSTKFLVVASGTTAAGTTAEIAIPLTLTITQ